MGSLHEKTIARRQGRKTADCFQQIRGKAMDTQAVNNTGNPIAAKLKQVDSSPPSKKGSALTSNQDIVNLSQEALSLAKRDGASANTTNYAGSEQRKFSVTDNNDVVLEVIDPKTHEVIRTVPSKEELELKEAIQNELDKI
jgi:uncharacterized FlaG/YvyC family protein